MPNPAEYRAVRTAVGIVARTDLAVLRMWGRDPVKMLQGLITSDLAGAPEGRAVYGAMLTPKGKTIAELRALRNPHAAGPEVLIVLPGEALEGTRQHLTKFIPPMFARWADESESWSVTGVYGPRAADLVSRVLGIVVAEPEEDAFEAGAAGDEPVLAIRTRYAGGEDGYDLVTPTAAAPEMRDRLLAGATGLGGGAIDLDTLDALRIEAGRPRYGSDIDAAVIPTEAFESTGQMARAMSFTKGCYTGQEVIVRIAHRGHVNRHLRGLLLGESPAPHHRTPLFHPESAKAVGWTTSAAHSPLLAQTIALGYLRREIEPGTRIRVGTVDGPEATVSSLPFSATGESAAGA